MKRESGERHNPRDRQTQTKAVGEKRQETTDKQIYIYIYIYIIATVAPIELMFLHMLTKKFILSLIIFRRTMSK